MRSRDIKERRTNLFHQKKPQAPVDNECGKADWEPGGKGLTINLEGGSAGGERDAQVNACPFNLGMPEGRVIEHEKEER